MKEKRHDQRIGIIETKERRKTKRVILGVIVDYIGSEAETKNISKAGMCITSKDKLAVGKIAELMFFLPDDMCIKAIGEVIWRKKISREFYDYGIQFIDIDPQYVKEIKNYIKQVD